MGLNESGLTGRDVRQTCERQLGLLLQPPESMTQLDDMGGTALAANVDDSNIITSFGVPFMIESVINAEETGGATLNNAVFDKNCPFKIKVLLAWGIVLDETGTMGADTVQLFQGDGATSEAFTAITDAISCNVDDDDLFGLVAGTSQFDQDACVIDANESLRIQLVLANAANHEISIKMYMLCMRVTADE